MSITDANVGRYLEMEGLLNNLFRVFDYCFDRCIKIELVNNGGQPVSACCKNKYYKLYDIDHPAFDLLRTEREKRFGKPDGYTWSSPVSPCEYHNPMKGCVLETHKSPICLALMCRESIDCLRNTYGIYGYDYLGMNYALEWILTGDFSEAQFEELKESVLEMITTIEIKKGAIAKSL